MTLKVAINGFGRIGRLVYRAFLESGRKDIDIVAINDLGDAKANAYLLKYDSIHGITNLDIYADGEYLVAGDYKTKVIAQRDPTQLPWKEMDPLSTLVGSSQVSMLALDLAGQLSVS